MTAPLPGVRNYELSYMATHKRNTNESRFRIKDMETGEEWACARLAGKWLVTFANCETFRIEGRGKFVFRDGNGTFYPPKDYVEEPYEAREELWDSHWRICANKGANNVEADKPEWRLQDERKRGTPEHFLIYVKGYEGLMNLNWLDDGQHVFHDGRIVLDTEEIAHFA